MTKNSAIGVKQQALKAVAELDQIVADIRDKCSEEEFKSMRRAVGNTLAVIINEILEPIYSQYPEIDDDRQSSSSAVVDGESIKPRA